MLSYVLMMKLMLAHGCILLCEPPPPVLPMTALLDAVDPVMVWLWAEPVPVLDVALHVVPPDPEATVLPPPVPVM